MPPEPEVEIFDEFILDELLDVEDDQTHDFFFGGDKHKQSKDNEKDGDFDFSHMNDAPETQGEQNMEGIKDEFKGHKGQGKGKGNSESQGQDESDSGDQGEQNGQDDGKDSQSEKDGDGDSDGGMGKEDGDDEGKDGQEQGKDGEDDGDGEGQGEEGDEEGDDGEDEKESEDGEGENESQSQGVILAYDRNNEPIVEGDKLFAVEADDAWADEGEILYVSSECDPNDAGIFYPCFYGKGIRENTWTYDGYPAFTFLDPRDEKRGIEQFDWVEKMDKDGDEDKEEKEMDKDDKRNEKAPTPTQEKRFNSLFERISKKVVQTFGNTAEDTYISEKARDASHYDAGIFRVIEVESRGVQYRIVVTATREQD